MRNAFQYKSKLNGNFSSKLGNSALIIFYKIKTTLG